MLKTSHRGFPYKLPQGLIISINPAFCREKRKNLLRILSLFPSQARSLAVLLNRLDYGESLVYWSLGKYKTLLLATGLDRSVGPTKKSTLVASPVRSETGIQFMV